ncbi:hypothetical protein PMI15_04684 [Polaromonas sp. CF318]|uniref:hypothetical protein n=1 Tax=Polaromonas sp. CF318 TaxID=1144318 RepID=UPI0002714521|nr:hypothetical protein [Polaromonas sp. CF318]EJL77362.1 hypothetical protein PMI15_04684 [Polaromonas sp. CF318]
MSARGLASDVVDAVQREHVPCFPLLKLEFDSETVYLAGTDFNIEYDGHTWLAARGIGTIEKTIETPDQVEGLTFTLSGVTDEALAQAQQEEYQGRPVTVLWAFLDGATLCVDPMAWQGHLDVPTIMLGRQTATIKVTAENRMADWQRPRKLLFNHPDQLTIDPTDNFFLGIEAMENAEIVIFSKESQMR